MNRDDVTQDNGLSGATTAAAGTPVPVDLARDQRWRLLWVVLLVGPVVWFGHFMIVYLVGEAGCTGGGPGLDRLNPPVPAITTGVVTVVAVTGCLIAARWAHRWWRDSRDGVLEAELSTDPDEGEDARHEVRTLGAIAMAGMLLSVFSAVAIIFVALPAVVFTGC